MKVWLLVLVAGCEPPIACGVGEVPGISIDIRECRASRVRAYVENTGDGDVSLAIEWTAYGYAGARMKTDEARRLRLYPEYGATVVVEPDVDVDGRLDLAAVRLVRTASRGEWTDVEVEWDEPVPHGAGVDVRARRCEVAGDLLRCELGARNFGAKAVDVALRAVVLDDRGHEVASVSAGRANLHPGDAVVLRGRGHARAGRVAIRGVVRIPPKNE